MALGAFLGGYADHYAIRYDQYSWTWSERARLFGLEGSREDAETLGSLTWFTSPEALMGAYIAEHLLLSGATVIDGDFAIPNRREVARRTKFALINDVASNNTPPHLYPGLYRMKQDGQFQTNRQWLKKTGRSPTIPLIFGDPADIDV